MKYGGIRYPGDDGSEPEEVRQAKAEAYAADVERRASQTAQAGAIHDESGPIRPWEIILTAAIIAAAVAAWWFEL